MTHAIGFGAKFMKARSVPSRVIGDGRAFTVELPRPPSVNNCFATFNNRRIPSREYKAWKKEAAQMLMAQRARCAVGPVEISITVEERTRYPSDIDNRIKPTLDCLVENGIIDGDTAKTVRRVSAQWGSVVGALVTITPADIPSRSDGLSQTDSSTPSKTKGCKARPSVGDRRDPA